MSERVSHEGALRLRDFRQVGSLMMRATTGNYRAHGNEKEADCVIGLSFGFRQGAAGHTEPGPTNRYLASVLSNYMGKKIIIAQFEVDDILRDMNKKGAEFRIERCDTPDYLDTRGVARRAVETMQREGLGDTAIVVAQPYHMPRADATLLAFGINTVVSTGIKAVWDKRSAQHWTRGTNLWRLREIPTIGMYAAYGWLGAER